MDYSVDYSIHVATREDALRLVQHMTNRSHPLLGPVGSGLAPEQGLHIADINAYVEPVIKQKLNQLVQIPSLHPVRAGIGAAETEHAHDQRLQMQEMSQLIHEQLRQVFFTYGMTVDKVKVRVVPRDEDMKASRSLKDFRLSKLDTTAPHTVMLKNAMEHHLKEQNEAKRHNMYMALQNRLNRYADEIAAIQAELESIRTNFGLRMDTHSARLEELSRVISSDLQASVQFLDSGEARPEPTAFLESQISNRTTEHFRAHQSAVDR